MKPIVFMKLLVTSLYTDRTLLINLKLYFWEEPTESLKSALMKLFVHGNNILDYFLVLLDLLAVALSIMDYISMYDNTQNFRVQTKENIAWK